MDSYLITILNLALYTLTCNCKFTKLLMMYRDEVACFIINLLLRQLRQAELTEKLLLQKAQ